MSGKNNIKWVLASQSPRRKELLAQIGLSFEVVVSRADENITEKLSPGELVERLSLIKAEAVRDSLAGREDAPVVIGADTVVYHNGRILGKPKDEEDAFLMLRSLSGDTHSVFTGVSILFPDGTVTFHSETKVTFDELSDAEIRAYIASGEPMDKAGAYGIQGLGGAFVTGIEGEYANVVGFPIGEFCRILRKKGLLG
ncbi:MAG: septum formation inhibitor Maf [Lachnospiraceae bacterium]|nr:septum formation inhibitor Maf [Lachnospiraceae bacterium]